MKKTSTLKKTSLLKPTETPRTKNAIRASLTKDLADRLKEFRLSLKMNQEAFAEALGTNQAAITRYETNSSEIPIDFVRKMVLRLSLNSEWFFFGKGFKKAKQQEDKNTLFKDISAMRTDYKILEQKVLRLEENVRYLAGKIH